MYRILILIIITGICIIAQLTPVSHAMTWDHELILKGEWWRILTGNLTHTNVPHLVMNIAALWLIATIFRPHPLQLLVAVIILSIAVGSGLMMTNFTRYVGLSGTLHGLFVYFALQDALKGSSASWLFVTVAAVKVGWEYLVGPSVTTTELIGAPIAIEAHLIGLISGVFFAFLTPRRRAL